MQNEQISIDIYDITGRLVKNLSLSTPYSIHPTNITWDGTDNSGNHLPAGVFFLHIMINDETYTKTVMLLH